MVITLNGQKKEIHGISTIEMLLGSYGMKIDSAVIEHNGNILKKEDCCNTNVKDNDQIEVITIVGGG